MFEQETSTTEEISPNEGQEMESAEETEQFDQQDEQQDTEVDNEETPEESNDDEGQGELIAGKFKSQNELVKAYKNLEREFHKSRQQPQQDQYQQQQFQQQTMQQQIQDPNSQFWDLFQQDPISTMNFFINNAVQEQTKPIYETQATQQLANNISQLSGQYDQVNTEDGLNQLFDKIGEISEELGNPSILENPSPRILRMAAQEAFGDQTAQLYQQAKQKGKEEAENNRKAKQGLTGPSGTKPKQNEKTPEEQLAEMIINSGRSGSMFG